MKNAQQSMDPPLIYLNNAATTWPKPPEVLEEVARCLETPLFEHGRSTAGGTTDYPSATREALAVFFHAEDPGHFIFTQNATDSLNLLIQGFVKNQNTPFHAITTELEHNSVLRPLYALAGEGRLSHSIVPSEDGRVTLQDIKKAICFRYPPYSHDPMAVTCLAPYRISGLLRNTCAFKRYLPHRRRGPDRWADSYQPVRNTCRYVRLYRAQGAVRASRYRGVFISRIRMLSLPSVREGPVLIPVNLLTRRICRRSSRPGPPNYTGIASLLAGIRYIEDQGQDAITNKCRGLVALFTRELSRDPNIILYTPAPDLPVVSFNIQGLDNQEAGFILTRAYNIIMRTGLHCAPLVHEQIDGGKGCIRASFSHLNTREQIEMAAAAIREVAEGAGS